MKYTHLLVMVPFLSLVIAPSVRAVALPDPDTQARQQARERVKGMTSIARPTLKPLPTVTGKRCEHVTAKINSRLNQYTHNQEKYSSRYHGLRQNLDRKLTDWKTRGCGTSALEADLTRFDTLIGDFSAAFRDFHATLQGSRAHVCGDSQGKFAGQVSVARQKLTVAKQKAVDLQKFVAGTLKPHARDLQTTCSKED